MEMLMQTTQAASPIRTEMPWEDFDDGGGYDDDASLIGKPALFAERLSEAGFRELLGFEKSSIA